ncbi:unnamed protein product [Linum trigynum]|uniref:Uncharacterized protein n=1 Tax=Linum trigynum TaxID=586398 RepID=A0AAV2EZK7_9ROSI
MSRGKQILTEDEAAGDSITRNDLSPSKRGKLVVVGTSSSSSGQSIPLKPPSPERNITCETLSMISLNETTTTGVVVGSSSSSPSSVVEPQDADYYYYPSNDLPSLSDELENLILARVPRSEYWKLLFVNKRIFWLVKSGELFRIRRDIGVREPSVFIFATGDNSWWGFDRQFSTRRQLPHLPADQCFSSGDKESVCAGTHLIISGREIEGVVAWRYQLETNTWNKGPNMIQPRCLFASSSCGATSSAYVAGGVTETGSEVLNTAERYESRTNTWHRLPRMHKRRRLCSGCYMDAKFYVLGGRNESNQLLTCGEAYDHVTATWELIPNMLEVDAPTEVASFQSPPLIAVANNELYSLETTSNELRVYVKRSRSWRRMGSVPVRADSHKGWGVAFKSLGNELVVIGACDSGDGMAIYSCCPPGGGDDQGGRELEWRPLGCGRNRLSNFIFNCSVMVA